MIFLVGTVSAIEWDNYKDYNTDTKTMTVKNGLTFGSKIAEIQLNTPINNKVGYGSIQKVAEFEVRIFNDYTNAFKELELYDKAHGNNKFLRNYDYKVLSYENITVDDYTFTGQLDEFNEPIFELSGNHSEVREKWTKLTPADFKKNDVLTIGIFTYVEKGDYVEWIPNFFGVRIDEWATWTASLNVDLVDYYNFDQGVGGDLIDVVVGYSDLNGTPTGSIANTSGIIGSAWNFSGGGFVDFYKNISNGSSDGTACFWTHSSAGVTAWSWGSFANGSNTYSGDVATFTRFLTPVINLDSNVSYLSGWKFHCNSWGSTGMKSWLNATLVGSNAGTGGTNTIGGYRFGSRAPETGNQITIDEFGVWTRQLSESEIIDLYNNGAGIQYDPNPASPPKILVDSPTNLTYATQTIFFNASNSETVGTWTLNYNGTNITNFNINTSLTVEDGNHHLFLYGNNSVTGDLGLNDSIYFTVDTTSPSLNVTEPFGVIDFKDISGNQTLRFNVSDANIDKCFFDYEGANTTTDCSTNITNFTIGTDRLFTFYVNDSIGNLASQVTNWSYLVLQTSTTFNSSSNEMASESFTINVTTNGSVITAGSLTFNDTENTGATITNFTGNNYTITKSITIPFSVGTKTHNFNLTVGKVINTTQQTQIINLTYFTLCNSTYTTPFVNFTFLDETDSSILNASIPSSIFTYWLDDQTINKSFTYSTSTEYYNYTFCGTPNRTMNVDYNIQYASTGYPQRIHEETTTYNSTVTSKILYLLGTADGIYVTFQVINSAQQTLQDVIVNATRQISSVDTLVGSGSTGADGGITFWLNPDFLHTLMFVKSGYTSYVTSIFPTQSLYTITLGGTSSVSVIDYLLGVTYKIQPSLGTTLLPDTDTNFNITLNSTYWSLQSYGFNLTGQNGTLIGTNTSSSSTGGTLIIEANTLNYTHITMSYFWTTNDTLTIATSGGYSIYNYTNGTSLSIYSFFTDLKTYSTQGILGLTSDGLNFIVFIIIFLIVGIASFKFSLTRPDVISGMVFALVFLFDFGFGMITPVVGVLHFATYFTGLITIALVIKENTR